MIRIQLSGRAAQEFDAGCSVRVEDGFLIVIDVAGRCLAGFNQQHVLSFEIEQPSEDPVPADDEDDPALD